MKRPEAVVQQSSRSSALSAALMADLLDGMMSDEILEVTDTEMSPVEASKPIRASSGDFQNILDTIMNDDAEFDHGSEHIVSQPHVAVPVESFAFSFADDSVVAPPALTEPSKQTGPGDDEGEMIGVSAFIDHGFASPVRAASPGAVDLTSMVSTPVAGAGAVPSLVNQPSLRKMVTLEDMVREAEAGAYHAQAERAKDAAPKAKPHKEAKEAKDKDKKRRIASEVPMDELSLPVIGHRPKVNQEDKAQGRRHSEGVKLPQIRKAKASRTASDRLDHSHEAEEILSSLAQPTMPPYTSPDRERKVAKKHSKPLYLRMMMKAQRLIAEEERMRQEEYAKLRDARAKGHYSREDIKQHMKQHDSIIRAKASESKQNHMAAMRALKKKNQELAEEMSLKADNESLGSIDSHALASPKHRKQMDEYSAVEYKVSDDARERKMKYRKLQDSISPKKKQHRTPSDTPASPRLSARTDDEPVLSPRAMLSPRTKQALVQKQLFAKEQEKEQEEQADDKAALDDIGTIQLSPKMVKEASDPSLFDLGPPAVTAEDCGTQTMDFSEPVVVPVVVPVIEEAKPAEEVDPFSTLDPSIVLDISGKDIPFYCSLDWMSVLFTSGNESSADTER